MKNKLLILLVMICPLTLINNCVSIARLSKFPKNSQDINFGEISLSQNKNGDWSRTFKGQSEFVVYVDSMGKNQLLKTICEALVAEQYKIVYLDSNRNVVIGKRGVTLWEWKSIVGVYYKIGAEGYKVYLRNAITQDFTGGFNFNRAQKVAAFLCSHVNKCKDSENGTN